MKLATQFAVFGGLALACFIGGGMLYHGGFEDFMVSIAISVGILDNGSVPPTGLPDATAVPRSAMPGPN